jgi:DHA1 family multidrug resistance protein-like MFS transporter
VCFLLINSLNLPLHQALLTTNKANLPVGELMGLFNAFRSIGQVAGSMVSGFSYTVGHALPFFCASAFFMMMVFILRWGTSGEKKRHANGGIKRRKKNG